jgi:hypothetical protein
VAAAPKQYAAIAKLEEVGAAQIAGVYRCEKQADAHQIAELMLTDIQEIAACE